MYSVLLVLGSGYGVVESYSGGIGYFVVHCVNEHSVPRGGSCHIDIWSVPAGSQPKRYVDRFDIFFLSPAVLKQHIWTCILARLKFLNLIIHCLFWWYPGSKSRPKPTLWFPHYKLVANFAMRLSRSCTNALLFWAAPALLTLKYNHSQ